MKQIILNTGAWTQVSDEDYLFLVGDTWQLNAGYAHRMESNGHVYMHKIIASRMGLIGKIDHKDRNRLNNQRDNLRIAHGSGNQMNREAQKNNASGLKGVAFHMKSGKWEAYISKNQKRYYLGLHETPEEAARAYNKRALELFGEFAVLNEGV